mgnify:CR=1 FL=1
MGLVKINIKRGRCLIGMVLGLFVLNACRMPAKNPYLIEERFTLAPNEKRPFGGYVFNELSRQALIGRYGQAEMNKTDFETWYNKGDHRWETNQVYVLATPWLNMFETEAEALDKFIRKGNYVLLLTDDLSSDAEKVLGVRLTDSLSSSAWNMKDTYKYFINPYKPDTTRYQYYYYPFDLHIVPSIRHKTIHTFSLNQDGRPDGLRIAMGSGALIMVGNARAFSNYFLLSKPNDFYLWNVLSFLPQDPSYVYWDDYYYRNQYRRPARGLLSAILSIPPLNWAFWLTLGLALLWVLSNLRRQQRMVPVLQPNTNTTAEFTQTIARLYYQKQDHALIARKMSTYLLDYLRNKYFMQASLSNPQLEVLLHHKTGLAPDKAARLVVLMQQAQEDAPLSPENLLELQGLVQEVLGK